MNILDLQAEIVPGKSAAGFELGARIEAIKSSIPHSDQWQPDKMQLVEAIAASLGWLNVINSQLNEGAGGEILYYGKGSVELHFNSEGILYCISVFKGYSGLLFDEVKIGDPLASLKKWFDCFYDEGDEIYYPEDTDEYPGVGFHADSGSPNETIFGMSIHDWDKQ